MSEKLKLKPCKVCGDYPHSIHRYTRNEQKQWLDRGIFVLCKNPNCAMCDKEFTVAEWQTHPREKNA